MSQPIKRIFRCRDEAQIAGVCCGVARYLGHDPVFVRVAALTVTFLTGILPGVLSYVAAWILIPQEPLPLPASPAAPESETGEAAPA